MALSNQTKRILRQKILDIDAQISKNEESLKALMPKFEEIEKQKNNIVNSIADLKDKKAMIREDLKNN